MVFLACWELIFASESTQYPALIIFSFLLSTFNINTYYNTTVCKTSNSLYAVLSLNERGKL